MSLPAPQVWLGAYQVDVMAHATGLPVLRLEQATFENFEFATGAMNDALCVTEADGRRRETLCELFRFATRADEGELPRIVVRAAPSPEALQPMAEAMARTGFWVHALRWHPCGTEFARGFFEWMAGILRDDPTRQAARVRALGLVRLIDLGISSLSQVDPRKLLGLCQDIVALASRSPRERDAAEAGANPVPGPGAADFAGMAARAEELLGDAVAATALRENCAALRAAVDEAFARLRGVIAAPTTDAASRSPAAAQALLAALSQLVAATPTQCRAPLPFDGDAPVARFWRIVFAIRQTEAAIRAIELATAGQPLLALAWLAPLDQQVTPPSAEDWQALPALMAESAGREAQAPIAASWLEALRHVLEAEQAWLARRGQLAFLALENSSCPAGDEHSVSSAAADSPLRLEWEQARLVRALLRLNVAWTKSSGRPALPDTLDLLDIALVLREQARVAAGIQATTSSRVNASET